MALDFDGVDDTVDHGDIPALDALANLTISCWANVDTLEIWGGFWSAGTTAGNCFHFGMSGGTNTKLGFSWWTNATENAESTSAVFTAGVWYHVAFVYDGGGVGNSNRLKLYVNGAAVAVTYSGTVPATLGTIASNLFSGRNVVLAAYTNVKLAQNKIWLASLTAAEIANEFASYRPVRTANLIVESPYDDDTSAKDYSGSGNHGTVTGALQSPGPPLAGWTAPLLIG